MITNIFSVFDPSTAIFSINWVMLTMVIIAIPTGMWNISNSSNKALNNVLSTFFNEVNFTLKNSEIGVEITILLAFMLIILSNFLALYPQVFSPTSHLAVTLPLSLTFWASIVLFGWTQNTNHILAHLVPQGTPGALMSFIVLIEITSNLIRPITLCVRLTANLIAGHLLITLLGNSIITLSSTVTPLAMLAPIILTGLESAVACIQAYVFITLITLYVTEVN